MRLAVKASRHDIPGRSFVWILNCMSVRQPRTLEVFHFPGVLPELCASGVPPKAVLFSKLPGGTEVAETTHLTVVEEDTPTKPFVRYAILVMLSCTALIQAYLEQNNMYQVPQYQTEAVLRSHLEKHSCAVEFSTELADVENREDGVKATHKKRVGDKEETEQRSFRRLAGADGGKST